MTLTTTTFSRDAEPGAKMAWRFIYARIAVLIFGVAGSGCVAASRPAGRTADAALVAPRMLTVFDEFNRWYPPASLRMHEAGRVVLHFTVNATGVAEGPFT